MFESLNRIPIVTDPRRVRVLKNGPGRRGPVIYWMSRDQRAQDNWALLHAQELALSTRAPLLVAFCLAPHFLNAAYRQYAFLLKGLAQTAGTLAEYRIPFFLLRGAPEEEIPLLAGDLQAGALVTDFDPLKIKRAWKESVARRLGVPFYEVDAHNIVPCWLASAKQEWAAYSFRPKIHRALPEFLTSFPELIVHPYPAGDIPPPIFWERVLKDLPADRTVPEVTWLAPGEGAARNQLRHFLEKKLAAYDRDRNDPSRDGQSHLSPYLHFGQLSAQRAALEAGRTQVAPAARGAFLEELIMRRELSDNFCFYNPHYDSFAGFPAWARKTFNDRRGDPREYLYTLEEFEAGKTHEDLWNAAQQEMVATGKMHGYLRMYWAKKILEWTPSPEEALRIAIYLNDRYELDGRDPNGYAGIAWSLGGVHDRAFKERPVFGKIRYMSNGGLKGKFPVKEYIARHLNSV